ACVGTPTQTIGPYFVEENLNRSDLRTDPSDGTVEEGTALSLALSVFAVRGTACTPLPGAQVDVWHCNATGLYSDESAVGTAGKKYLRGFQMTDADGAVSFQTIYPGWYPGRTVHIHVRVRYFDSSVNKTYDLITQLYFDDATNDLVFARAPYAS